MLLTFKSKNAPSEFQKVISPHLVDQKHPAIAFSKKLLQPLLGIIKLWAIRSGDAWNYLMQKSSHFLDFLTWDLHTYTALEGQPSRLSTLKNKKAWLLCQKSWRLSQFSSPNSSVYNYSQFRFDKLYLPDFYQTLIFGYKFRTVKSEVIK